MISLRKWSGRPGRPGPAGAQMWCTPFLVVFYSKIHYFLCFSFIGPAEFFLYGNFFVRTKKSASYRYDMHMKHFFLFVQKKFPYKKNPRAETMVSYENTTKKGVHRPTVRTGPGGHIGGPIGHPYFPGKFEEFLHTLLDFRDFPGDFRRIGTHTSGIFEISREFKLAPQRSPGALRDAIPWQPSNISGLPARLP